MYQYILFDMDGTLTDSKEGIVKSFRYALEGMGEAVPPEAELLECIGPPLEDSFSRRFGFDGEKTRRAVRLFRERYNSVGKFENAAAPGSVEMCRRLTERGCVLAIASSKLLTQCVSICEHFGFSPYLREIVGTPPGGGGTWDKAHVIQEAMKRLEIGEADRARTIMAGDRKYDVEGALRNGIACVGTEFFGYAAPGELKAAGAAAVVRNVAELERFLLR